jgi:hypothetical protein
MRRLAEALRPSVLEVVPGRTLRWLGHLLLPGIFDGEHHFEIEPLGGNPLHARAAGTVLRAASAAVSKEPGRALGGRLSSHECRAQGAGGSARRRARGAPARVLALTLPAPAAQPAWPMSLPAVLQSAAVLLAHRRSIRLSPSYRLRREPTGPGRLARCAHQGRSGAFGVWLLALSPRAASESVPGFLRTGA